MTKITLKSIDNALQKFTTNRDTLKALGHEVAMMIFYHAAPKEVSADCNGTGDCTRAAKLLEAMPNSWGGQYRNWLLQYTPIRVSSDKKNAGYDKKYSKLTPEEKLTWWKLEEANTTPFHELDEPEPKVTILDFEQMLKMIQQMAGRIEKKMEDDEVKPEDMTSATVIVNTLKNLHFERIGLPANDGQAPEKGEEQSKPKTEAKAA